MHLGREKTSGGNKLYFEIKTSSEIDESSIELLDRLMHKISCYDIYSVIYYIRIIFKNYDENYLKIILNNEDNLINLVFEDSKLISYINVKENKDTKFKFQFDEKSGVTYSCNNKKTSKKIYDEKIFDKEFFNDTLERLIKISEMENIKKRNLKYNEKILVNIYEKFYNESPDFSIQEVCLKAQSMMYMLCKYGISLENDNFTTYKGKVYSEYINGLITSLAPYGELKGEYTDFKFSKYALKIIESEGKIIRMFTSDPYVISNISSIMYLKDYVAKAHYTISNLINMGHINLSLDEALKIEEFIKELDEVLMEEEPLIEYKNKVKEKSKK